MPETKRDWKMVYDTLIASDRYINKGEKTLDRMSMMTRTMEALATMDPEQRALTLQLMEVAKRGDTVFDTPDGRIEIGEISPDVYMMFAVTRNRQPTGEMFTFMPPEAIKYLTKP